MARRDSVSSSRPVTHGYRPFLPTPAPCGDKQDQPTGGERPEADTEAAQPRQHGVRRVVRRMVRPVWYSVSAHQEAVRVDPVWKTH
ncbi:hypothetical protein ACLUXI_07215 [Bifidobacterium apri]|uniref:hypothetical protein n=1 Tax=Bifidobacterium apri TaxID=1769423 RepID=UPI003991DD28